LVGGAQQVLQHELHPELQPLLQELPQELQPELQQPLPNRLRQRFSQPPQRWPLSQQHGTSRHSQWPRSTQRRQVVVTGLQVTVVCITVRSSTLGTQTHTQRVSVRVSGTCFHTVQVRVRVSG
jgi:hypothetical protein